MALHKPYQRQPTMVLAGLAITTGDLIRVSQPHRIPIRTGLIRSLDAANCTLRVSFQDAENPSFAIVDRRHIVELRLGDSWLRIPNSATAVWK